MNPSAPSQRRVSQPSQPPGPHYRMEKIIGKGNFAVVKLATHTLTQTQVSVCVCVCTYMCVCECTCVSMCISMCVHVLFKPCDREVLLLVQPCMWHRHHSLCACGMGHCCQKPHALAPSYRPTHTHTHVLSIVIVNLSSNVINNVCGCQCCSQALCMPVHHLTHSVCAHTTCEMCTLCV